MKVFELQNSFGIDSLTVVERDEPTPAAHQVMVRVRAVSLNYRDLLMVKGLYNPRMPLPRVPMSDGAGEVVAVGDAVTRVKVGDRVAGIFMQTWTGGEMRAEHRASALGGEIDGMFAEYVALDEAGVVRVPEHFTYEEAATLPCAGVTAWNALFASGNLTAGETVLVQGTGGVSLFALQFARLAGARVIVTSSSNEKLDRALQLGASDGINYRDVPEWNKRVRELTGGRGVDYVVEVGGAGTLNKSLAAVRTSGTVSMIGVLTGISAEVSTAAILQQNVRVQGIFVGSREMFEEMNRAIELHKLRPVIDRVFEFDAAREAFRHMEAGAHFGKIVVRIE
ncbi:MAG: NAD(P)-dependent alcohol dehydrogenase [Pyrinomonadaceae bacterium]|nr:NAD(P)-dependent alcohol dehydrogenase [Pyrinomonadaceae bacterium]